MSEFHNLQNLLDQAVQQMCDESSMLLGQTLTAGASDILNSDRGSYLGGGEDGTICILRVEAREAYQGEFYILLGLSDTIALSSTLLGIPEARIKEKRRLCIQDTDDVDAFAEIANQMVGSLNTFLQSHLQEKIHLKLMGVSKYVPGVDPLTDEEPLPNGSYVMYRMPLEFPHQEMNPLDILMPHALVETFLPVVAEPAGDIQAEEDASTPLADIAQEESKGDARWEQNLPQVLVVGEEKQRRVIVQVLTAASFNAIEVPVAAQVEEYFSGAVDLVVVALSRATEREISVCKKIAPLATAEGVVALCAPEWTRITALKALQAGAKGILLYPFNIRDFSDVLGRYHGKTRNNLRS